MNRPLGSFIILSAGDHYIGLLNVIRSRRNGVPICVQCEREIPPGKAGRKCKECRKVTP